MLEKYLQVHPEVQKAVASGQPVVALESTIISHGMPYPKNIEMAKNVSKIIRDNGAIPATIAIIDGVLKVGLTTEEIELLGTSKNVVKASRRDLPFIISKKLTGATTVATTMILANLAGVKVFATGGIGGVHRGAQETFDISADLQELANTDVAVICAGAKSILDIGLTLEYLETNGVPVIGFGTDEMPAFYTRRSGFGVDYRVDSSMEVAQALKAKWDLNLKGGMVIGNPIPEEFEMDYDTINNAIESALKEAKEKNIGGKNVTPFLLDKVKTITEGKSLEANIELVYNNAKVGAQIAKNLSDLNNN
ncbi:pseudouridine-5'-phosphate glycosidase [Clostridium sp. CCUG 7971]|uniref:pseudouridine-5'-phosphate glycosidase n=1 Tax=Clostridium sp. CCUG 7971 TaxID=2811414 RepID=UPI001ABAD589|nr:pseudouridine-5'-phosphate glycosidase [Clostridium sp. CCUG 7971]MBO3446418.1 pseudouridine-5'-phosphate glycosidase [Clostridium sp. CCUG 7971]